MHQGGGPQAAGLLQQRAVIQWKQAAGGVDAVSKRRKKAHVGQLGAEQLPGDERVGVAVGMDGLARRVPVGDHQPLSRLDSRLAPQIEVVPVQLPQGNAVKAGDAGQGLPRLDGVESIHMPDHQRLPHRQHAVRQKAVEFLQNGRVRLVTDRDAVQGVAGPHYMYLHNRPSLVGLLQLMRERGRGIQAA